ncbi:MAG: hypothetical protein AB7F65_01330 [Dehalococcoidia bacterium]
MIRRPALIAGTAAAVLAALFSAACSSEEEPLTAEQAAAIAQAGLLTQDDLPSAEWVVTEGAQEDTDGEVDDPTDTDDLFANTEACQALDEAMTAAGFTDEGGAFSPLAEAERSFDFEGGESLVARSVQAGVLVRPEASDIDEAFEALREVMSADAVRPCLESAFTESLGGDESGLTISTINVTDVEKVTDDGVGIGLDVEAVALIIPINLHMEIHMWPEGPAAGQLILMELNSETVQDATPEILEAARTRLAEAVEANR